MHGERHTRVRLHDAAGLDGGRKIASPLIPFLLGVRAFLFIFICWFSVHMWTRPTMLLDVIISGVGMG